MKSSNLTGKEFLRICLHYGYYPGLVCLSHGRAYLSARRGDSSRSPYAYYIYSRKFTYDYCKRILQQYDNEIA